MIRFNPDAEVNDQQLIFFASELEYAVGHLNDCIAFAMGKELVEARQVVMSAKIVFKDVLEGYRKSKVVNPKLALKGDDLVAYADQILDLCPMELRDSMKLLPN